MPQTGTVRPMRGDIHRGIRRGPYNPDQARMRFGWAKPSRGYFCKTCAKRFDTPEELGQHMRTGCSLKTED